MFSLITERLSNRLKAVASFVEEGAVVADIGSDHAYLPCYLLKTGKINRAIAGEVANGPYDSALKNVLKEGLSDSITVRLADGLFAIEETDLVDTITIAGMGGTLIASILENGKSQLASITRIIVQPNIQASVIRKWAVFNEWKIASEQILKEDDKIYEILTMEKGLSSYDETEILLGPFLCLEKSVVFREKWEREIVEWQRVLLSIEDAEETDLVRKKKNQVKSQIELVRKVLAT